MSKIDHNSIGRQIKNWLDTLEELVEANVVLKHRLSGIIAARLHERAELEILEAYQNSFVNKDAHLSLLYQDIKSQEKEAAALSPDAAASYTFSHQQQKLQYDVMMMSEQFRRLKESFEEQFGIAARLPSSAA